MYTITLPDTPSSPIDLGEFTSLIEASLNAFNSFLCNNELPLETIHVIRPNSDINGYSVTPFERPNTNQLPLLFHKRAVDLQESKALLNYLWLRGACKQTISKDDRMPDRLSWEAGTLFTLIAVPLSILWDEISVRSLAMTSDWAKGAIPSQEIASLAQELASHATNNGVPVRIIIPLLGLTLKDEKSIELENGLILHPWSLEDLADYYHRDFHVYGTGEKPAFLGANCYLEVMVNDKKIMSDPNRWRDELRRFIGKTLARIKWAIMVSTGSKTTITELPATVIPRHSMFGHMPIRRQLFDNFYDTKIAIWDNHGTIITKNLSFLSEATMVFPDLEKAVNQFDRATMANLPEDTLIESTIGLECLLVPGPGESNRRFKTYGASLLLSCDPQVSEKRLKEIYGMRGNIAHGNDREVIKLRELSSDARFYLGEIILNISRLVTESKIKKTNENDPINKVIEQFLTEHMYASAREVLLDLANKS